MFWWVCCVTVLVLFQTPSQRLLDGWGLLCGSLSGHYPDQIGLALRHHRSRQEETKRMLNDFLYFPVVFSSVSTMTWCCRYNF